MHKAVVVKLAKLLLVAEVANCVQRLETFLWLCAVTVTDLAYNVGPGAATMWIVKDAIRTLNGNVIWRYNLVRGEQRC